MTIKINTENNPFRGTLARARLIYFSNTFSIRRAVF
jgi:hypothetical protein